MRSNQRQRSEVDTDTVATGVSLGPLAGYVGFMLRRIQSAVFAEFIASLGELDLRPAQYTLMEVIDANPGLRQSDAATALGIQKANFVALVFIKRGQVTLPIARQGNHRADILLADVGVPTTGADSLSQASGGDGIVGQAAQVELIPGHLVSGQAVEQGFINRLNTISIH